jgi:2-oxoglutarate ferredoxin oxidoreductase subunit alpha
VNTIEIRITSERSAAFVDRIDLLIPLNKEAIPHLEKRISKETIVIGEKDLIQYDGIIDVNFTKIASGVGSPIFANTIAVGLISALLSVDEKSCTDYIAEYFARKGSDVISKNVEAIKLGHAAGKDLSKEISISIKKDLNAKNELMMSGADAVAAGALAGGCSYVCGYPMSPSTTVLEKMAQHSESFDVIVEQVEDEVGVINMALGASYAGARALVTTSGGGFALMCEGVSLCGMIETPLVVHLAQRPGPATGLPTRTEQGDLNLALYAGHGDFPRIILAPGTLEQGFTLTQKAFNLSAKYQVPVFILTDQYFVDTYYNTPAFDLKNLAVEKHLVETNEDYKRFALADNGISPRGVPGFGSGIVCVDSDEHDEGGYITEDLDLRVKMVDKRLRKNDAIMNDSISPTFTGNENASTLVVSWGSNFHVVNEALKTLGRTDLASLHFSWVYPIHQSVKKYFDCAKNIIIVENNATAQFAQILKLALDVDIKKRILKYNGLAFSVEEIADKLKELA